MSRRAVVWKAAAAAMRDWTAGLATASLEAEAACLSRAERTAETMVTASRTAVNWAGEMRRREQVRKGGVVVVVVSSSDRDRDRDREGGGLNGTAGE